MNLIAKDQFSKGDNAGMSLHQVFTDALHFQDMLEGKSILRNRGI